MKLLSQRKFPSALVILNKIDTELLGSTPNSKLAAKFSYIRPVFPDYHSVSYDYDDNLKMAFGM